MAEPTDSSYIMAAKRLFEVPGDIEIEENPILNYEDGGCWVEAWLWIEEAEIKPPGKPMGMKDFLHTNRATAYMEHNPDECGGASVCTFCTAGVFLDRMKELGEERANAKADTKGNEAGVEQE